MIQQTISLNNNSCNIKYQTYILEQYAMLCWYSIIFKPIYRTYIHNNLHKSC